MGILNAIFAGAAARCSAVAVLIIVIASSIAARADDNAFGPFGPLGARLREQWWIVPGADPQMPLRATLFRPSEEFRPQHGFPLVVINHGTDDATRQSVSMPVYYWLSRWFVDRGYAVLLPQRRGHGATAGNLAESIGTCDHPDHFKSGLAAAGDIGAALDFMRAQPFIDPENVVVAGISSGGWASLAFSSMPSAHIRAVINFAGGRGGHAHGEDNAVCDEEALIASAGKFARTATVPTIWYYAYNDSYFGPELAAALAHAWAQSGGAVDLHMLPNYRDEGHGIADDRAGWDVWGPSLDRFLSHVVPRDEVVSEEASEIIAASPDQVPAEPVVEATPAHLQVR